MNRIVAKGLEGKEVRIYPSDTKAKCGKVIATDEQGVLFEITKSNCPNYVVGKKHYIAYSAKLSMEEV